METTAGWSSLPADLTYVISCGIRLHADYIRFRAVCSSWRSAVPGRPCHLPPQLPFLLLPPPGGAATAADGGTLYSPTEDRSYSLRVPGLEHHSLGSSHGWLVLLGPSASLSVLNPFTGAAGQLPPATSIPFLFDTVGSSDVQRCLSHAAGAGWTWWRHFVHKAKICWDRVAAESLATVVVFPKTGLALWRPGHKAWTRIGRFWRFADVELYDGRLYAVTRGGILSTIDALHSAEMTAKENVIVSLPPFSYNDNAVYLVASPKGLLLVVRRFSEEDPPCRCTIGFEVFMLVEPATDPKWAAVGDLDDQMLIVERGTSVALSTLGLNGCEANCIYFAEEYDVCWEDHPTVLDVKVFNMADGSINLLNCHAPDTAAQWRLPTWINPYLW